MFFDDLQNVLAIQDYPEILSHVIDIDFLFFPLGNEIHLRDVKFHFLHNFFR